MAVPKRSWVPLVQEAAGDPPVLNMSLYVLVLARPLPPSENPDQLKATWPLPAFAVRVPLVGGVVSRRMESEAVVDTLPAASLYQT